MLLNILNKHGWYKQRNIWINGAGTTVDNECILWLNEKLIEEGLDHQNVCMTTGKYLSEHSKQPNRLF